MQKRFPQIPPPELTPVDYEGTLARVKARYQEKTGHRPDINDPETFELEQLSYEVSLLTDNINREAKQNLLAYATGAMLDNIGMLVATTRLPAASATTSAKLTLTAGHPDFVLVAGFAALANDGKTVFKTTQDYAINHAQSSITVPLTAEEPGVAGNGFLPGEITQIVEPNSNITGLSNTTTSQGGADIELDDSYAERIFLAPSRFSVAGPYDAYKYWALSTSSAISDAGIDSPVPNDITICAVLKGGVVPDQAMKEAILAVCSAKTVRPLGDRVSVIDPTGVEVEGEIDVELFRDASPLAEQIKQTLSEQAEALAYAWSGKLGTDVVPERFIALGQAINGVYRCTTTLPYTELGPQAFPKVTITAINITLVDEVNDIT